MWTFAYGSLMTDGWERAFDGEPHPRAVLAGYRRGFVKLSTANWGTPERPCPTLGLLPDPTASCVGVAFRFDTEHASEVYACLRRREGPTFDLVERPVELAGGASVAALVAVNRLDTPAWCGDLAVEERAAMVAGVSGTSGACRDYVTNVRRRLRDLGIRDPHVERFAEAVSRLEAR